MSDFSSLLQKCIKIAPDGDFHLEHLYDEWSAGLCSGTNCKDDLMEWSFGKTAEEAMEKLLERAEKISPPDNE